MSNLDWGIVIGLLSLLVAIVTFTKKYLISVADFLAANRCAGRYLLAVAIESSGVGAISILALFELYYKGGFSAAWWNLMVDRTP